METEKKLVFESDFYIKQIMKLWDEGEKWASWISEVANKYNAGKKILDVPCGIGRISHFLSKKGFDVVGVDISEKMIKTASENTSKASFRIGDMRYLTNIFNEEKFDIAININNSLGYYNEEEDVRILEQLREVTKNLVIINLDNRDYTIYNKPSEYYTYAPPYLVLSKETFDPTTSRLIVKRTYFMDDKEVGKIEYSQRLYSLHEVLAIVKKAGLKPVEVVAGHSWKNFSIDDSEMTIISSVS
ncbi:class I SAM-dependent methyltransferase [Sulfuracidifex tepidarius]|uniref:Ubiquinone biosynthesis O-methyltransferase n=1 Tax=Sulfuracidifex tepidarius TaxID=1294262 RepID=A0A510DRF9_9CREN|nr:class I SAM-dependent methyltransferase [Sulfuracidifex tepidarius]BBG22758.1 Ubiquinone biosynthesis O-methyltransferase [Sulfuracidifex tepidarius]BBG25537.1 Ubiquinone biosynthesis O-methyltransferase [Sulfuracidifex tepidarius]